MITDEPLQLILVNNGFMCPKIGPNKQKIASGGTTMTGRVKFLELLHERKDQLNIISLVKSS